ncbi:MAG: GH36 C-terminal domain-containing protein [Prevotella sp.]|nr:GH36 C-terminal domain-containing protein [Prevotella sp.]
MSEDKNKAVVFIYQVKDGQSSMIKLKGLDPVKKYRLKELNLENGQKSSFDLDSKVLTGHELMNAGFMPVCKKELESMIIGLNLE